MRGTHVADSQHGVRSTVHEKRRQGVRGRVQPVQNEHDHRRVRGRGAVTGLLQLLEQRGFDRTYRSGHHVHLRVQDQVQQQIVRDHVLIPGELRWVLESVRVGAQQIAAHHVNDYDVVAGAGV